MVNVGRNTEDMTRDEMLAYWNYSRILKTIPEKDYEQPQIRQFLDTYAYLEDRFMKKMHEVNDVGGDLDNPNGK